MSENGWIGVDLDGTLAYYDYWRGPYHIGPPIEPMLNRIKKWIEEGKTVKIFTARIDGRMKLDDNSIYSYSYDEIEKIKENIKDYCEKHTGKRLDVVNSKDYQMIELWDDRAIQMIPNTGKTLHEEFEAELTALKGKP